jgi:hypothetical protein
MTTIRRQVEELLRRRRQKFSRAFTRSAIPGSDTQSAPARRRQPEWECKFFKRGSVGLVASGVSGWVWFSIESFDGHEKSRKVTKYQSKDRPLDARIVILFLCLLVAIESRTNSIDYLLCASAAAAG